jgi:hypothetical protein
MGCLDIDHTLKQIKVFDPDNYLSFFDIEIENSDLLIDPHPSPNISLSRNICEKLLIQYAKDIGYTFMGPYMQATNIKSTSHKILDGRNCVLLTILHKDYNFEQMSQNDMAILLENTYEKFTYDPVTRHIQF